MANPMMILLTLAALASTCSAQQGPRARRAQPNYPPELVGARTEVYKTVGDVKLNIYIFEPSEE